MQFTLLKSTQQLFLGHVGVSLSAWAPTARSQGILCLFASSGQGLLWPSMFWIFLMDGGWAVPVAHSPGVGTVGRVGCRDQALRVWIASSGLRLCWVACSMTR